MALSYHIWQRRTFAFRKYKKTLEQLQNALFLRCFGIFGSTGLAVKMIGVDIFAGAGGMSLGARLAGIDVAAAIDIDKSAAATYRHNHPFTRFIKEDIAVLKNIAIKRKKGTVLFGGPPCQGFSTSNQRTRSSSNQQNWLYLHFVRLVASWRPDWVVFENVKGFLQTAQGLFFHRIVDDLDALGYKITFSVLCASEFNVPQNRKRFFLVANQLGVEFKFPTAQTIIPITVRQAIADLPHLKNGASVDTLPYCSTPASDYQILMRGPLQACSNHLVTRNSSLITSRYRHIKPGMNWQSIPPNLMNNYSNTNACHTGIYRRLHLDRPATTISNFRKNMLIHPTINRGLSVREAARLQSFPDSYVFIGSIGFQQQQVSNAVPPLLAKAVFSAVLGTNK